METMLHNKQRVSVLEGGPVFSRVYAEGKEEYSAYTVKTADLKPLPVKRQSAVDKALSQDPEVLASFAPYVSRILVSSSPDGVDGCAQDISANSDISETDAMDYVKVVTDKSHGAKFDILVSEKIPEDLRNRMGVFFNEAGHRAKGGELQIGSRPLVLWLMNNLGLKPEKSILDQKERS